MDLTPSQLAAALGRLGGVKRSAAKAKAAKANGKKGGRPRAPKTASQGSKEGSTGLFLVRDSRGGGWDHGATSPEGLVVVVGGGGSGRQWVT
jgi:hypothetical protein